MKTETRNASSVRSTVEEDARNPEQTAQFRGASAASALRALALHKLRIDEDKLGINQDPSVLVFAQFKKSLTPDGKAELCQLKPPQQIDLAVRWVTELAFDGRSSQLLAGISYIDSDAGSENFVLVNRRGQVRDISVPLSLDDPQSNSVIGTLQATSTIEVQQTEKLAARPSDRACDPSRSREERIEALRQWMIDDNDAAAEFIVTDLASGDIASDWRNTLIYAAQVVRFQDVEVRACAVDVLLKHAITLRRSNESGVENVVWCAIHRVGSIIPVERANELAAFLAPSKPIDTRLAGLQTVVRIFEVAPPDRPADFLELANRAASFARALWNPDVFTAGELSAIAIEATVVMATLADERVLELVALAHEVDRSWVMRNLHKRFNELSRLWGHLPETSLPRAIVKKASALASQHR